MTETNSDQVFGRASVEQAQGFSPLPDPQAATSPDTFKGNQSGIAAAAEELKRKRDDHSRKDSAWNANEAPITERQYREDGGQGAPVDPTKTVDLRRAARDLTQTRTQEADAAAQELTAQLLRDVDAFRNGDTDLSRPAETQLSDDPPVEPEATASHDAVDDALTPQPEPDVPELSPLQMKLANLDPEVKEALTQQSQFIDAVQAATVSQAQQLIAGIESYAYSQVPEFNGLNTDAERRTILKHLVQTNPQRAEQVVRTLQQAAHALQGPQAVLEQNAQAERLHFEHYAKEQDQAFERAHKMPAREFERLQKDALQTLKDAGLTEERIAGLYNTSREFRSVEFQSILAKAAKYARAVREAAKPVKPNTPPVMRPGVRGEQPFETRDNTYIKGLERKANASGSAKDFARLLSARRAAAAKG
jgi:hypothetical protein